RPAFRSARLADRRQRRLPTSRPTTPPTTAPPTVPSTPPPVAWPTTPPTTAPAVVPFSAEVMRSQDAQPEAKSTVETASASENLVSFRSIVILLVRGWNDLSC